MIVSSQNRAVTPVIATILMVALVVILAATVSVAFSNITENINEPAPIVADTTGEFVVDAPNASDNQFVQITHVAGDSITAENIEIVVQASGDDDFSKTARLVNFPNPDRQDSDNIIDDGESDIGFNTWSPGRTIEFRINTGGADFRIPSESTGSEADADTLEVRIVHTPSKSIISEHIFTP